MDCVSSTKRILRALRNANVLDLSLPEAISSYLRTSMKRHTDLPYSLCHSGHGHLYGCGRIRSAYISQPTNNKRYSDENLPTYACTTDQSDPLQACLDIPAELLSRIQQSRR